MLKIKSIMRFLLSFAALFLSSVTLFAQNTTLTVPQTGGSTETLLTRTLYTVLDNGGQSNYSNSADGYLLLVAPAGYDIHLTGNYWTEQTNDYLEIFDAQTTNQANRLGRWSGQGTINVTCVSGYAYIHFYSNSSNYQRGFQLDVKCCLPMFANLDVYNVRAENVTENSLELNWVDLSGATEWRVHYGTTPYSMQETRVTHNPYLLITNLQPRTYYYFRIHNNTHSYDTTDYCTADNHVFLTACPGERPSCINFTDLTSCWTYATYGTFWDPDETVGVYDQGSASNTSCHTVHTDTTEYDPRTGNQLRCVPPGEIASVRLGNWGTGAKAESIKYEYKVDTLISNLLILKYAAVLENPGHSPAEQPRFTFKILDEYDNEIDAVCYSADFIAAANLGWNTGQSTSILWKDWTTVGVDLTSLQGKRIFVKLTTYDCSQHGHYGYAYFVLKCSTKTIQSSTCGNVVENTFTAPDGFSYEWYNANDSNTILSTEKSLHVTRPGVYNCRLNFVGGNSSCSFIMSAIAGTRYPCADFSYGFIDTSQCKNRYQFYNESVVAADSAHNNRTTMPCDAVEWDFGDGTTSTANNPVHAYSSGVYRVRQVAKLAGGMCTDTLYKYINVVSPCQRFDTLFVAVCYGQTYRLFDTVVAMPGVYERDSGILTRTLYFSVVMPQLRFVYDTIVENQLPYTYGTHTYAQGVESDTIKYQDFYGCDSIINYSLHVWPNVYNTVSRDVCVYDFPITWNGVRFSGPGTHDAILTGCHGEDSVLTMIVNALLNTSSIVHDTINENYLPWNYHGTIFTDSAKHVEVIIRNRAGCDSVVDYTLSIVYNITTTCDKFVQFPNVVTANGDGINDKFAIVNLLGSGCYPINSLAIYDRWGALVYSVTDIRTEDDFWDPAATRTPAGTYFYRFVGKGYKGNLQRTGVIEVLR